MPRSATNRSSRSPTKCANLSSLLNLDRSLAIVLVGALATAYVSVGGMRSVVYTNVLHAPVKRSASSCSP
ncbi:sodium:solute symporter family transporter [Saccharopolyspora endophytica]|uniref:Uncharacterized protein n=1 Tax=Saccharopolyspora endophytica TaxID=543886 RepID=A0ABS5DH43_9PSEU|nr:hypothetical protein [Saccharopolyspora endophytica]MBQ0925615.1 hypothetical protein [Saccharopolyspora endophytica]